MKKSLALILVLLFCLLPACGNDDAVSSVSASAGAASTADSSEPTGTPGSGPASDTSSAGEEEPPKDTASASSMVYEHTEDGDYLISMEEPYRFDPEGYEGVWETMKLIAVDRNPQGGLGLTALGESGSLLTFAAPRAVAYNAAIGGEPVLRSGMTVRVGYDGAVRETYPGQITADYVIAEEYDGGLISLYLDVLEELYGQDDGMNDSCTYFGFDLSEAPGLTPAEQQAVGWVFASSQGCEPLFGTIEELGQEGYINMEGLYWEDGLHFTLRADSPAEDCFTLDCTKWKSGTGAIGYQQAVGKKDGVWTMGEASGFWIS